MLAGCVSGFVGGNRDKINASYAREHLIIGKTTKAEVRRLFGEPSPTLSSVDSDGEEGWVYTTDSGTNVLSAASNALPVPVPALSSAAYIASSNQGAQGNHLLKIWFNARGVVRRWAM